MPVDPFKKTKQSVLAHIQQLFEEMEKEIAISHQEKYALLEDAFESASDVDELKVAFRQWHHDHAEEVEFDHTADELWDHAVGGKEETADDDEEDEDDDLFDDDEDDDFLGQKEDE